VRSGYGPQHYFSVGCYSTKIRRRFENSRLNARPGDSCFDLPYKQVCEQVRRLTRDVRGQIHPPSATGDDVDIGSPGDLGQKGYIPSQIEWGRINNGIDSSLFCFGYSGNYPLHKARAKKLRKVPSDETLADNMLMHERKTKVSSILWSKD
jgi:hypothetical protein